MKSLYMIVFISAACSPGVLTPEELNAYVRDEGNGLRKAAEVNDFRAEVTYRPTDLWVHQEVSNDTISQEKVEELRKRYGQYYYFILSLSRNNREALHAAGGGMEHYSSLVQTLSFRMADYVTLTTAVHDTIPVGDFILNRTYGMSSSTDLLFVFSRKDVKDSPWVQFNLNEFGLGIGNQRFRFKTSDLNQAPGIDFEKTN